MNVTKKVSLDNLYHIQGRKIVLTWNQSKENYSWVCELKRNGLIMREKEVIIFDWFRDDLDMIAIVMLTIVDTDKIAERETSSG